jgi:N-formylmaleamate deformylase
MLSFLRDEQMSLGDFQSGEVDLGEVRLHWTRTGGGHPPVVLAHGLTDDGLCWTPVAEALEGEYDLVMVDFRGHGLSSTPETGYDPDTLGRDLLDASAALGLDRPVIAGHSLGALAALIAAGTRPSQVRGIFLEDPPGWWTGDQNRRPSDGVAQTRSEIEARFGADPGKLAAQCREDNPRWSDEELRHWIAAQMRVRPQVLGFLEESAGLTQWGPILAAIECPVRLVAADVERSAVSDAAVAALAQRVPQVRASRIAGAGHSVRRDALEEYLVLLREFLRDCH